MMRRFALSVSLGKRLFGERNACGSFASVTRMNFTRIASRGGQPRSGVAGTENLIIGFEQVGSAISTQFWLNQQANRQCYEQPISATHQRKEALTWLMGLSSYSNRIAT